MKKILTVILGIFLLILLIQINSCKDENNVTEPEQTQTKLSGTIDYPFSSTELSNLTIGFGQEEYHPDSDGKFNLTCNNDAPGMAIVSNAEGMPQLLGLVPNPSMSSQCKIDIHSTALSLVFLNPFICSSDPSDAEAIVQKLENLPELSTFENLLEDKLEANSNSLVLDDIQLQNAFKSVIASYINLISPDSTKNLSKTNKIKEEIVTISPVNIVSGHQIQHMSDNNFSISNWYGRWAKCIIPDDILFLPPNNDFMSFTPWAASQMNFKLDIIPNDPPKEIIVYGLGKSNDSETTWNNLTDIEKEHVLFAGEVTVLIEFLPRILSLTTNLPFTFGSGEAAALTVGNIIRWRVQYAKNSRRADLLCANGDYYGYYWATIKEFISLIVTDDDFRELILKAAGITLSKTAFESIGKLVFLPLNVLYIADDLTGLAKSTLALSNAGYKTTFKVYTEEYKFGNVNGNVYDKTEGTAIQGVKVQLLGDEDNPMDPNYIYTTDANGGFWFENILEGEKSLLASKNEYGAKTIEIEVKEGEKTEVTIQLSKEVGTIKGRVVNEIFINNGINPTNFNKACHLDIIEIGGNNESYAFWIGEFDNGEYSKKLLPGTYQIKALHEDYKEATTIITIAGDEITQAEDLILKPNNTMTGYLYYDINFDGSYEYKYDFEANDFSCTLVEGNCPDNSIKSALTIIGLNDNEFIDIIIDTAQIIEGGEYNYYQTIDIGDAENAGCETTSVLALTKRFKSQYQGIQYDMIFAYFDYPDAEMNEACNCGITNPGSLELSRYGKELTDIIEGSFVVTLAGWNGRHCGCCDEDGNYEVDCAKMNIDVKFKIMVGSYYDGYDSWTNELLNNAIRNR